MSGFPEVVGAISAVAQLLDGAIKLTTVVNDVRHADKERAKYKTLCEGFLDNVRLLDKSLKLLQERKDASQDQEALYYEGLFTKETSGSPLIGKQQGSLVRLHSALNDMVYEVRERHGLNKLFLKLRWPVDKDKLAAMLRELQEWRSQLELVLQTEQLEIALEHLKLTQEVKKDTGRIDDRTIRIEQTGEKADQKLSKIQDDQRYLRERKEKKDREALHMTIAEWVSRLDFEGRHFQVQENCIDISRYLTSSLEFNAWQLGRRWILFCHAKAGAGKTMLSCLAVDHLRRSYENTQVPVLCVYLNHKEHNTQTSGNLIGGLLRQLLEYRNYAFCSSDLIDLYNRKGKRSRLTKKELQQAFCNEIRTYERVIVVVDALDEGSREMGRFYQEIMPDLPLDRLSVMVTSREDPPEKDRGIRCSFGDEKCESGDKALNLFYRCDECVDPFFDVCYPCHALNRNCGKLGHELVEPYDHEEIYLKVDPTDEVISEFVKAQIHGDVTARRRGRKGLGLYKQDVGTTTLGRLCKKHPGLEDRIIEVVVSKADSRFQLAKLFIDQLREQQTEAQVDAALDRLPKGYDETYDQTVQRIMEKDTSKSSAALSALSWVVHAHRPLDLPELEHALAIKPGIGFSVKDVRDKETLLENTESLLFVESDEKAVRLTHYTAYEYFIEAGSRWLPSDTSALIARACLQYFSIEDVSTPCSRDREMDEIQERKDEYPFLKYAYEYWGRHVQEAGSDPDTWKDALEFLKNGLAVETLVQALWYIEPSDSSRWEIRRGANALHVAAWFGLTDVLSELKSSGLEIDAKDPGHEQTPLMYASRRGHADTVAELIRLGASVNLRSARGDTAIVEAVREGHASVVHVLLKDAAVKINDPQIWSYDRTVLMVAVTNANTEILDALLARKDLEVNQADLEGLTALHLASYSGREAAVRSLLAHPQLDINARNRYGYTALFYAAECADEDAAIAVSKLLLERRAKTFYRDKTGGATAITRAVDSGYRRLVAYLLEQRAFRLGEIDSQGRGLLHAAAVGGQSDMAEELIFRYKEAGIEVDTTDSRGRTPLHDACRAGSLPLVTLLTDSKANPLIKDHTQRNCLQVAWQNGHDHIVDYFTDPTNLFPNSFQAFRPNAQNLPLWSLAMLGERRLITTKLEQPPIGASEQVDPDTGNTPVYCAVLSKDPTVLDLLLKAGLSPATPNGISRTPLHEAAIVPNVQLIDTLLDHDPDVNVEDEAGTTPIRLAFASKNSEHALSLIEAGASVRPKALILPLFFKAIEYGYIEAVKILINKFHAPVLVKNKYGESALTVANPNNRGEIMRLLVQNRSVYYHERVEGDDESEKMDLKKMDARGAFSRPEIWDEVEEDEKEILATQEEETGAHSDVWPSLQGVADLGIGEDQQTRAEGTPLAHPIRQHYE